MLEQMVIMRCCEGKEERRELEIGGLEVILMGVRGISCIDFEVLWMKTTPSSYTNTIAH